MRGRRKKGSPLVVVGVALAVLALIVGAMMWLLGSAKKPAEETPASPSRSPVSEAVTAATEKASSVYAAAKAKAQALAEWVGEVFEFSDPDEINTSFEDGTEGATSW